MVSPRRLRSAVAVAVAPTRSGKVSARLIRAPQIGVALRNGFLLALFPPNLNRTIALSFSGDVPCAAVPAFLSLSLA
jgi:hypothetical protein